MVYAWENKWCQTEDDSVPIQSEAGYTQKSGSMAQRKVNFMKLTWQGNIFKLQAGSLENRPAFVDFCNGMGFVDLFRNQRQTTESRNCH